jgi:hypothetical protein
MADLYFPDVPGSNCGSGLARDGGLIGDVFFAGVHIHFWGNGFYWFRPYGESLGRAPSNQTLLPLSYGASPEARHTLASVLLRGARRSKADLKQTKIAIELAV